MAKQSAATVNSLRPRPRAHVGRHLRETSPTHSTRAHENVVSGEQSSGSARVVAVVMVGRGESLKLVHVAARCYVEATSTQRGRGTTQKRESTRSLCAPATLSPSRPPSPPEGALFLLSWDSFFGKGQTRAAADFGTRRLKSYEPHVPIARVSPSPRARA